MYTASRSSSLGKPPSLPHSCIPPQPLSRYTTSINSLPERGTTPPMIYDIRLPPSSGTSRRYLVVEDRSQYERASNPKLGCLTICTALVSKPKVVFLLRINGGAVTVQDVLLAVQHALRASALDDQHHRGRRRHAALWKQGAPRPYRPSSWRLRGHRRGCWMSCEVRVGC